MFTPQQLQQISFDKAVFGGYDMDSVDEVLEPLLEDYETLYRENALCSPAQSTGRTTCCPNSRPPEFLMPSYGRPVCGGFSRVRRRS